MQVSYDRKYDKLRSNYDRKLWRLRYALDQGSGRTKKIPEGDYKAIAALRFQYETTRGDAGDVVETGVKFVKDNPLLVVGSAFAIGLLVGAVIRRKSDQ
jgi:ElaB/YqjD/DUF883 family membrane-anchored ribosome-binding protein